MKLSTWFLILLLGCVLVNAQPKQPGGSGVREVNQVAQPSATSTIAIVGATLIDGRGGPAVPDSVVVIRGERIAAVGTRLSVKIPDGAEIVDVKGLTILPGLIDAHFHIDGDDCLPALFLSHRFTSLRDAGPWIEAS